MRVVQKTITLPGRSQAIEIIPLGDIHLGCMTCDEAKLVEAINYVNDNKYCYWIGMGDYCEFINRNDTKRFQPETLAKWIKVEDLSDLVSCQRDKFLEYIKPIAHKCLGLVCGNHEDSIRKYYERNVYMEIVDRVKKLGRMKWDEPLAVGYNGWVLLRLIRKVNNNKSPTCLIRISLHHGDGGGRSLGGKMNRLIDWMRTHQSDITIMGHHHNTTCHIDQIESVTSTGKLVRKRVVGVYSSTFKHTTNEGHETYAERKQYPPLPTGYVRIIIKPNWDQPASPDIRVVL